MEIPILFWAVIYVICTVDSKWESLVSLQEVKVKEQLADSR